MQEKPGTILGMAIGFFEGVLNFAEVSLKTVILSAIGATIGYFVTSFWKRREQRKKVTNNDTNT